MASAKALPLSRGFRSAASALCGSLPVRVAVIALAFLLAASGREARAGVIVTPADGCISAESGFSPDSDGSAADDASQSLWANEALPSGGGSSGSSSSNPSSGPTGVSAVVTQSCSLFPSAFSAGVLGERALLLPASPVFNRLRPPRHAP